MEQINIVYVDDDLDAHTSQYLNEFYENSAISKHKEDLPFSPESDTYETLLNSEKIQKADVIIIDSKLFQNQNMGTGKLSGEEFRIILKKIFPFKEVIVITQNSPNKQLGIIPKYDSKNHGDVKEHYNAVLKNLLDDCINKIIIYRTINSKLQKNENINSVLTNKIENNFKGILAYDNMTKKDLDDLISCFESIKAEIVSYHE